MQNNFWRCRRKWGTFFIVFIENGKGLSGYIAKTAKICQRQQIQQTFFSVFSESAEHFSTHLTRTANTLSICNKNGKHSLKRDKNMSVF